MTQMSGKGGLLPEQVWDSAAIPERGLYPGQPSGSAMPLVWAHAEYVRLLRSRRDGRVFDRPAVAGISNSPSVRQSAKKAKR